MKQFRFSSDFKSKASTLTVRRRHPEETVLQSVLLSLALASKTRQETLSKTSSEFSSLSKSQHERQNRVVLDANRSKKSKSSTAKDGHARNFLRGSQEPNGNWNKHVWNNRLLEWYNWQPCLLMPEDIPETFVRRLEENMDKSLQMRFRRFLIESHSPKTRLDIENLSEAHRSTTTAENVKVVWQGQIIALKTLDRGKRHRNDSGRQIAIVGRTTRQRFRRLSRHFFLSLRQEAMFQGAVWVLLQQGPGTGLCRRLLGSPRRPPRLGLGH